MKVTLLIYITEETTIIGQMFKLLSYCSKLVISVSCTKRKNKPFLLTLYKLNLQTKQQQQRVKKQSKLNESLFQYHRSEVEQVAPNVTPEKKPLAKKSRYLLVLP